MFSSNLMQAYNSLGLTTNENPPPYSPGGGSVTGTAVTDPSAGQQPRWAYARRGHYRMIAVKAGF
jgi:hypothetical protein